MSEKKFYEVECSLVVVVCAKDKGGAMQAAQDAMESDLGSILLISYETDITSPNFDGELDTIPWGEEYYDDDPDLTTGEIIARMKEEQKETERLAELDKLQKRMFDDS